MVDVRERLYDCSVALIVQQMARRRSREEGGDTRSYQLFNERPGRSRPILHNFWFFFSIDLISFFNHSELSVTRIFSRSLGMTPIVIDKEGCSTPLGRDELKDGRYHITPL